MATATQPPTGNHSNASREELIDILSTSQRVSLSVPYLIIEPVALVLNFLLLFIIWKQEKKIRKSNANAPFQNIIRSQLRTYYFLRHLVFSDLLTCFVAIPFDALEIYRLEFRRSRQYCATSKYVRFVAISTSFYILVVTNFERFWSLMFPFRQLSARAVAYMTRSAWLAAFVFNVPSFFLYHSKVEYMYDNDRYYVRVCVAEPGIKGSFARAYLGVSFLIPAITIAVLSCITTHRVIQIGKDCNRNSPKDHDAQVESSKSLRNVAFLSFYITAGFWLCSSPAGFYYLIIAGIGRPEFPTSYIIGRSIVIIANASAAVNPIITILCFQPIRERAKMYLRLGAKESYSTDEGKSKANTRDKNSNVELLAVKIRSSFRKARCILKGNTAETDKESKVETVKTDGAPKDSSGGELTVIEETLTSVIEGVSNDSRQNPLQNTEI